MRNLSDVAELFSRANILTAHTSISPEISSFLGQSTSQICMSEEKSTH